MCCSNCLIFFNLSDLQYGLHASRNVELSPQSLIEACLNLMLRQTVITRHDIGIGDTRASNQISKRRVMEMRLYGIHSGIHSGLLTKTASSRLCCKANNSKVLKLHTAKLSPYAISCTGERPLQRSNQQYRGIITSASVAATSSERPSGSNSGHDVHVASNSKTTRQQPIGKLSLRQRWRAWWDLQVFYPLPLSKVPHVDFSLYRSGLIQAKCFNQNEFAFLSTSL